VRYTETPPPLPLSSIVRCIWTLEGHAKDLHDELQPVLPDGCPELIIHLGDAFERVHPGGMVERQPPVLVAGQLTRQLVLRARGRISVVGVRFHPDTSAALLRVPQHELAGLTIGVDAVASPLCRSLTEIRETAACAAAAVPHVLDRLAAHADVTLLDPRVHRAVEMIGRRRGWLSIDRLARHLGVTRRHLQRRFKTLVGISPKRLARIERFQHALRMLDGGDRQPRGTLTAAACGYADQAHFVREFRELAGCPPGAHLMRHAELTGFFTGQSAGMQ
jgi:AraC-like DNA-binding protein